MENAVIEKELETTALTLKQQASAMVVKDVSQYAAAGELGKSIKELRGKIVDYFAPIKKAAHEAHKAITAKESEELKPVDEAIGILRDTMNAFTREQERIRQGEERKAREAAEELARKERDKLLAAAIKAEEKGQIDKAEAKMEQAEMVYAAPVTVAPTVAKTVSTASGNITQAKEVQVTVVDLKAFLTAVIAQYPGALQSFVDIKPGPLKTWIKSNGNDNFPGLNIVKTTGVRF